ncbi:MAG TPA: alkene reductase [Polyangiaceae bacterium]|nr:alkene reductase [Polyangiaceae bacterium]
MPDSSPLFEPIQLGALRLPQRIVMAPMTRCRAGAGNVPTELNALYYAQRASAGLIISEGAQIAPEGQGYGGTPGIHTDAQVAGWSRVTRAVHDGGGRIFLQLWHVGRISHPDLQPNGALPVAPSALAPEGHTHTSNGPRPYVTPRALETSEVPAVVEQYARATRHARDAGFDGVEIHAANGYLIEQFLLDGTNQRSDAYGGSIEKRARFLLEVTSAVVGTWQADRVGVRLSPRGKFNGMSDSNREATFGHAIRRLDEFGLAYLHLLDPLPDSPFDNPAFGRLAPQLRQCFRGPLIINGNFDRAAARAALERGEADLVAFGVPFLANPDLPERLRHGSPLNPPDRATFYGGDARGYTDYPTLSAPSAP